MQTLYDHPDWTFIVNFLSIFLAVISLLLTIKLSFDKELGLITWDTSTVYENNETNRVRRRQLHKLNLAFQNLGKSVIYKNDLVNNISIDLNNVRELKKITFESNCKFNTISYEFKNHTILFNFDFLEGYKYLRAAVEYYSEENLSININGKIIGGNEINTTINTNTTWEKSYRIGEKDARARLIVFPFVTIVLMSLSLQVFLKMFNLEYSILAKNFRQFNIETIVTILIGLIVILICFLTSRFITRQFIPYETFMKKEKIWYPKNST